MMLQAFIKREIRHFQQIFLRLGKLENIALGGFELSYGYPTKKCQGSNTIGVISQQDITEVPPHHTNLGWARLRHDNHHFR